MSVSEESPCSSVKPYISPDRNLPEFTARAVISGIVFGILFGAATVYMALKSGLTVSASIPIAVLAISFGHKFLKTNILENNIMQTTGSTSESIAAGAVFSLPGLLFLSANSQGESMGAHYFSSIVIFILGLIGGTIGVLLMIPLRRALTESEHGTLPYPEGTACAQVLIAGDKGGDFAKTAYWGVFSALIYAFFQHILHLISACPTFCTSSRSKYFPAAVVNADITPEYLGVGYIVGTEISNVMVAGGVLAWLALIPLLATLVPPDIIATQLVKLGELKDLLTAGGPGTWDPVTHTFSNLAEAIYRAYVRQIGAGAVAAGGLITLVKTLPTIISSFKGSFSGSTTDKNQEHPQVARTERDLSWSVILGGVGIMLLCIVLLPLLPGTGFLSKLLMAILVLIFGFFFVTVSSRIVGLIGVSSNPTSGMTIATIMGSCLVLIAFGWTGKVYEPMVLVIGALVAIAVSNSGSLSQNLKTGFLIGATPKYQQLAMLIGIVVSALVTGVTMMLLDHPTADMQAAGITHAIGSSYFPAPQGTLMATLVRGLLSFNLDWQYVIVGAFLSITIELCGANALSFAVGAYLPLSTTLPIFIGGQLRGLADRTRKQRGLKDEGDLGSGSLFSTGLVAGGALAGVVVALLSVNDTTYNLMKKIDVFPVIHGLLGEAGYHILGVMAFLALGAVLYKWALKEQTSSTDS